MTPALLSDRHLVDRQRRPEPRPLVFQSLSRPECTVKEAGVSKAIEAAGVKLPMPATLGENPLFDPRVRAGYDALSKNSPKRG